MVLKEVSLPKRNIDEVAKILHDGLQGLFEFASVSVVDCPDLSDGPFNLAAKGLGGHTAIADIGGPPYLIPLVQRDKTYSFQQVANATFKSEQDAFLVGAGAGPFHLLGHNCELVPNILLRKNNQNDQFEVVVNKTHYAKLNADGEYSVHQSPHAEFGLMGNMFVSEGKPGRVLKIEARKRIGKDNFVNSLRAILKAHYGDSPVSLGGAFLIAQGKAKLHIMPDFSTTPLLSDDDVNNWLKFFEMNSPLVCLGVLHSHDPGLDLRIEHTHCFSGHNQGGHYHYDTTPADVSYLAYFNIAEKIVRIDAPTETHSIGRD